MKQLLFILVLTLIGWTGKQEPKTIVLQPYEQFPKEYTQYIKAKLNQIYPSVSIADPIDLPRSSVFYGRHRADTLIECLSRQAKPNTVMVGLTDQDITSFKGNNDNWGIFGLGFYYGNACTISSFRLSKANKPEQLFKTVIHELGHTAGLDHCPTPGCYMQDAEGKNKFNNEAGFCPKCKSYLIKKGWKL